MLGHWYGKAEDFYLTLIKNPFKLFEIIRYFLQSGADNKIESIIQKPLTDYNTF